MAGLHCRTCAGAAQASPCLCTRGTGGRLPPRLLVLLVLIVQLAFVAVCVALIVADCEPGQPHRSPAGTPTIFVITPTFARVTQKPDLTRLSHTLQIAARRHAIVWILVEDAETRNPILTALLSRSGLAYVHLNKKEKHKAHHFKGGDPRNEGIRHIRGMHPPPHLDSVVYFADDDNSYDERLFDEIAQVRTAGVWPVGYSGGRRAEFPVVQDGRVVRFEAYLAENRKFATDMAGFAIGVKYLLQPKPVLFTVNAQRTTGETRFLEAAGLDLADLQPLAANCTAVLVWHVKSLVPFSEFHEVDDAHLRDT
eukprot:m.254173 g.254173  ORF g.254173 m.254173 type:complete len:310 (-) comp18843_c0_seq1:6-935(-)